SGARNRLSDPIRTERPQKEVKGAGIEGAHRLLMKRRGEYKPGRLIEVIDNISSLEVLHFHIEKDQVGTRVFDPVGRPKSIARLRHHVDAVLSHENAVQLPACAFVFDRDDDSQVGKPGGATMVDY